MICLYAMEQKRVVAHPRKTRFAWVTPPLLVRTTRWDFPKVAHELASQLLSKRLYISVRARNTA
jgi:hypothetical protein